MKKVKLLVLGLIVCVSVAAGILIGHFGVAPQNAYADAQGVKVTLMPGDQPVYQILDTTRGIVCYTFSPPAPGGSGVSCVKY